MAAAAAASSKFSAGCRSTLSVADVYYEAKQFYCTPAACCIRMGLDRTATKL